MNVWYNRAMDGQQEHECVTNSAGGRHGRVVGRFDLLPPLALRAVAQTLEDGERKYGDTNLSLLSPQDNLNHALAHIFAFTSGDRSEDHAAHAATRILMWLQNVKEVNVDVAEVGT